VITSQIPHMGTHTLTIKSGSSMVFSEVLYIFSLARFRDAGSHGALFVIKIRPEDRSSIELGLARLILLVALHGHEVLPR